MGTFNWSPGIGDPSIMGWATVLLYLVAAVSCWRVARGLRRAAGSDSQEIVVWRCLTALLLALGINKQLDLQSALTEAGRVVAYAQGWYGQRRIFQAGFIAVIAVLGLAGVIMLFRRTRHAAGATRLAALGAVLLVSFVVIRAASFHHFDRFIGARFLGLKWNWILEIDGIALMLIASVLRRPKGWGRKAQRQRVMRRATVKSQTVADKIFYQRRTLRIR